MNYNILIICITVVVLAVFILLYKFFTRPFTDTILDTFLREHPFYNYMEKWFIIEREYKSGGKKIIKKKL